MKTSPPINKIFKENYKFLVILVVFVITIYFNSLDNQLTLVDDRGGFTENLKIRDLGESLKTFRFQRIIYSLSYHLYGLNPVPLRVNAVIDHTITTVLVFFFVFLIYGKKKAAIASLIFAAHPINTESVTWVSGLPHLHTGLFTMLTLTLYVLYSKTQNKTYLYFTIGTYLIYLIGSGSPWVLVLPLALIVLDQFLLNNKINLKRLTWMWLLAVPVVFYIVFNLGIFSSRIEENTLGNNPKIRDTQDLKPVIEGYPYTTYLFSSLYVFPKDLTVYYEGREVTTNLYISMYSVLFLHIGLLFYLWKANRRLFGLFLMLPVLIAPTYSPVKVTWFLAERYLYTGTAFFGILVATLISYINTKTKNKYIGYGFLAILLTFYSIKTISRNDEWQNTETLSLAHLAAFPKSARPYNDLGGHYFFRGEYDSAVDNYNKALEIVPNFGPSIDNLGYLYLDEGPLIFRNDFIMPKQSAAQATKLFDHALSLIENKSDPRIISYYLNRALARDVTNTEYMRVVADFYSELGFEEYTADLREQTLRVN